jgi:hypothetical protein
LGTGINTANQQQHGDQHQPGWCKWPKRGLPSVYLAKKLVVLRFQREMESPIGNGNDNPIGEE